MANIRPGLEPVLRFFLPLIWFNSNGSQSNDASAVFQPIHRKFCTIAMGINPIVRPLDLVGWNWCYGGLDRVMFKHKWSWHQCSGSGVLPRYELNSGNARSLAWNRFGDLAESL